MNAIADAELGFRQEVEAYDAAPDRLPPSLSEHGQRLQGTTYRAVSLSRFVAGVFHTSYVQRERYTSKFVRHCSKYLVAVGNLDGLTNRTFVNLITLSIATRVLR